MRKGFTLIELLVVITILAILAGAALPFVQNYVAESRIAKAKSDLDEISRALVIYESREGDYNKSTVEDLTGRYLDRSPIDPWGVPYVVATESGIVFSKGPDRKGAEEGDEFVYDNIEVSYVPPLALVSVKWVDKNKSGAVDTQNVQDELHLTFSRKLGNAFGLTASLTANPDALFDAIEIANNPDDPEEFKLVKLLASGTLFDDAAAKCRIVGNDKIIVLSLSTAYDTGTGKGHFVAGRDKIRIANNHGLIVDCATPTPNFCIAEQPVVILAQ